MYFLRFYIRRLYIFLLITILHKSNGYFHPCFSSLSLEGNIPQKKSVPQREIHSF